MLPRPDILVPSWLLATDRTLEVPSRSRALWSRPDGVRSYQVRLVEIGVLTYALG
jgi:hypothetical protein